MENQENFATPKESLLAKESLTQFYKESLPAIFKTVFAKPINGTYGLLNNPGEKAYQNSLMLMGSVALLYILVPFLLLGDYREFVPFSALIKIGLGTIVFMLTVSGIAFGIKSIGGKPAFKSELFTGALSGIGLLLLLLAIVFAKILVGDLDPMSLLSPFGILEDVSLLVVIVLFAYLFMVNILQQSLLAAKVTETIAWYASPLGILMAFYITSKITKAFF